MNKNLKSTSTSGNTMGKRDLMTVEEMAKEMKPKKLTPAGEMRLEALQQDIAISRAALQRAYERKKVDLEDAEEIKARVDEYFQACEISGSYPSWIGLCTRGLGIQEANVKGWMMRHPNAETSIMLATARDVIADILINQSLAGNASPVPAIFQLKNWYNHKDKVEVAAMAIDDDNITAEEVRKKYAIVAQYKGYKVVEDSPKKEDSPRKEDSPD